MKKFLTSRISLSKADTPNKHIVTRTTKGKGITRLLKIAEFIDKTGSIGKVLDPLLNLMKCVFDWSISLIVRFTILRYKIMLL